MIQVLLIFIAGMAVGALVPRVSAYWQKRHWDEEADTHVRHDFKAETIHKEDRPVAKVVSRSTSAPKPPAGVVAQQKEKKEANMTAILGAFAWATEGKLRAEDVEKMLGVSESTALRYLDELEKEHKIRREIAADRRVYYVKVS